MPCYTCNKCGRCIDNINELKDICVKCGTPLDEGQRICPVCGAKIPPPPGAIAWDEGDLRTDGDAIDS